MADTQMADRPENWNLVHLLAPGPIILEYLAGPRTDDPPDIMDRVNAGEVLTGQPEARSKRVFLRNYSDYGIEVTSGRESDDDVFYSWASVLRMWGPSREELIQMWQDAEREAQDDSEQASPT
jgi:hypothetical protein